MFMRLTRHAETRRRRRSGARRGRTRSACSPARPRSSIVMSPVVPIAPAITSTMPYATATPSSAPTSGGEQVVGEALEHEQLHEVAAAGADGPRDAELAAPLGREHHEDQEDQQDAGGDRERAEGREQRHERRALRRRRASARPAWSLSASSPSGASVGVSAAMTGGAAPPTRRRGWTTSTCLDEPRPRRAVAGRRASGIEQAAVGRAAAVVAHDRAHACRLQRRAGEDADACRRRRASSFVAPPSRSGRPRRARASARDDRVRPPARIAPNAAQPRGVGSRTASRAARSGGSSGPARRPARRSPA